MRTWRISRGRRCRQAADRPRPAHRLEPSVEAMDGRLLLSAGGAAAARARTGLGVLAAGSAAPIGYAPAQIRAAYGIGAIVGDGSAQTISIVSAYADPRIRSDLAAFDAAYGLPGPPSLTVHKMGATPVNAGWAMETALDVEWAHAMAPGANIVLVEATSGSVAALYRAVRYARNRPGVGVVSMSWGTGEYAAQRSRDGLFATPAGHVNVAFVAASGDSGTADGVMYPAASPNVLAVGGTTLTLSGGGSYGSEAAWADSTGGTSRYESAPAYQVATLAALGLGSANRTTPDVAFNADPNTGFSVYDSVRMVGRSGWFSVGGTSAGAPAWAGLVAIADQGRATAGRRTLSAGALLNALYAMPASNFNEIVGGSIGFAATAGYNTVTGLGTPKANLVVAGLVLYPGP